MQSTDKSQVQLSPRLQAVAELVPTCGRLLDIGTDHAWLPIELVRCGRCQNAMAIDIRPGPLMAASRNIRSAGLTDRITTHMADGLAGIELKRDDAIAIAGLGGYEMMHILSSAEFSRQPLILQPMKSLPELRRWLCSQNFQIEDELLAAEGHRQYAVIRCCAGDAPQELSDLEANVGPVLLRKRPPGFTSYLTHLSARLHKQQLGQPEIADVIRDIRKILNESEGDPHER